MSGPAAWKRRVARRLVRHAGAVLYPVRPEWSAVHENELEHVPDDHPALMWAVGCVWASYLERYLGKSRSLLAATAAGMLFAFLAEAITGRLAAVAWPHWYIGFARAHRHVGLELWSIVALTVPMAVLAAACGLVLRSFAGKSSIALPCLAVLVWQLNDVVVDIYSAPADCPFTLRSLWESFTIFPTSSWVGIALPACALVIGFRLAKGQMPRLPDTLP
jgi:hypothetical protein